MVTQKQPPKLSVSLAATVTGAVAAPAAAPEVTYPSHFVPSEIDPSVMVDPNTPDWERSRAKYRKCNDAQISVLFRLRDTINRAFDTDLGLTRRPKAKQDNRAKEVKPGKRGARA